MCYTYSRPPHFASKTVGFVLLGMLLLTLLPFASLSEAALTGNLAYAVNGFDENLGRFDWNLYTTTMKGTKDLRAAPLNLKGMYPSWGPNGDLLYFIQRDAGHSNVYSINPENPKNKKLITPIGWHVSVSFRFSEWQKTRFQRLDNKPTSAGKPNMGAGYRDRRDGSYDPSATRWMALFILGNLLVAK